jgi:hypothetical protein
MPRGFGLQLDSKPVSPAAPRANGTCPEAPRFLSRSQVAVWLGVGAAPFCQALGRPGWTRTSLTGIAVRSHVSEHVVVRQVIPAMTLVAGAICAIGSSVLLRRI